MENYELNRIIQNKEITIKYQPIICLSTGKILGYEALCRGPRQSSLHNPTKLFELADKHNKTLELNCLCVKMAIQNILNGYDKLLFINVDTDFFLSTNDIKLSNEEFFNKYNISSNQIVYEVTERKEFNQKEHLQELLEEYNSKGFGIAIDDIGTSFSGLKRLVEIKPNYIKLDRALIENIENDKFKHTLIKSLVQFSRETKTTVIAEGIETKEELKTLIELGVNCGQGYYIQYPSSEFKKIDKNVINFIQICNGNLKVLDF